MPGDSPMIRSRSGGALPKLFLLLVFVSLLVGFFVLKERHGVIGTLDPIPGSSADVIAFMRQDGGRTNLYSIKSDGSDLRQLTDDKGTKRSPAWSPDGNQICYAAEPESGGAEGRAYQLFLKGGDREPRQATRGSIGKDSPQWRPDGKLIGFLSGGVIKVIQPNGEGLRQVYPAPHKGGGPSENDSDDNEMKRPPIVQFQWAPNGVAIAGVQVAEEYLGASGKSDWWRPDQAGKSDIPEFSPLTEPESVVLLPNVETEKPTLLAHAGAHRVGISWLPDSVRLVAALSNQQKVHVLGMYRADDPMGQPFALFVSEGYSVAPENPAVSPDGTKVAFELWRMESPENRELLGIAVVPTDSSLAVRSAADIAKIPLRIKGDAHQPKWSPDGTRILYWSSSKNGRDLWVAREDGTNPVNLTKGAGDNFDAAWSPARRR